MPSKTQITHLGERLRVGPPTDADLELLRDWRRGFDNPLGVVLGWLSQAVPCTGRSKTVNSITAKLQRQRSLRLPQMEDIAGVRTVKSMLLDEQDELVELLREQFPDNKVYDRRERPSSGYRAVHVVVSVDDCAVEVQIRTHLQDLWAQAVEGLADRWGQQIKYGGAPNDPQTLVVETEDRTRGQLVDIVTTTLPPVIAELEDLRNLGIREDSAFEEEKVQAYMEGRVQDLREAAAGQAEHARMQQRALTIESQIRDALETTVIALRGLRS